MRLAAVTAVSHNSPGKGSITDQGGQTQEDVELDSLIDSGDTADIVSISHQPSDTDEHLTTPGATR